MRFSDAARESSNLVRTENNALAYSSTGSPLVDLFGAIGALRKFPQSQSLQMFQAALDEDKLLATKMLFYARNVRGGLGERTTFRLFLDYMANAYPETIAKNISIIPHFGRWDDLYVLVGTPVERNMWAFVRDTLREDTLKMDAGLPVSLCAKWLKSINTSSKESVELGKKTALALKMTERQYRKTLSALRRHIDLVEPKMSGNKWYEIDYEKVPSLAMKQYRKAFGRHDYEGFSKYIAQVTSGEKKINASTLFPYDILMQGDINESYRYGSGRQSYLQFSGDAVLEQQWKALPNFVKGEHNVLVMADTSGSMAGLPMATSVGLAVYFAERNKGAYHNLLMTFASRPSLVEIKGSTLREKIGCIPAIVDNTNLEKAFDLILEVALENKVSQEEMPKALIVISDMQFDEAQSRPNTQVFYKTMKKKFVESGYEMPLVIFWQVEQRRNTYQAKMKQEGVILVSGHSPSVFKSVLENIGLNPRDFMVETLNDPAYACVKV